MIIIAYIIVMVLAVWAFKRVYPSFRNLRGNRKTAKNYIVLIILCGFVLAAYDRQIYYDEELYKDYSDSIEIREPTYLSVNVEDLYRQAKYCEAVYASSRRNQCFEKLFIDTKENLDFPEQAYRHCDLDGNWLDWSNKSGLIGWTDFIKCFPPDMQDLLENVSETSDDFSAKIKVAAWVREIECFGLTLSTETLILSLIIFTVHQKLLNHSTRIHRHLFSSILGETLTMLLIYIDQEAFQILSHHNLACIIMHSILEGLTSISFSFMFIEGINLYRIITTNALDQGFSYFIIVTSGYLYPIVNTILWFATASLKYGWDKHTCWFGYNSDPLYFLLQVPRLCVIVFHGVYMGYVVFKLMGKLNSDGNMTEVKRVTKALLTIAILMPLLGISVFFSVLSTPLRDTTEFFTVWKFAAFFIRSIQGLLVSYVFCFRNKEVLEVLSGRPKSNVLGVNDLAVHFQAYHTVCEIIRRGQEDRVYSPEDELPMFEEFKNVPLNDDSSDEVEDIEAGVPNIVVCEAVVHRCDEQ